MRLPVRLMTIALFSVAGFTARASSPVLADMDCADFASHEAAQAYSNANGGSAFNNVDNLDADHDGIACETRPRSYQSSSSSSSSGSTSRAITPPVATRKSGSGFPWGIVGLGAAGVGGAYAFAQARKKRPAMASLSPPPSRLTPASASPSRASASTPQTYLGNPPTVPAPPQARTFQSMMSLAVTPLQEGWPTVTAARARELAAMPYQEYLQTIEWKMRASSTKIAAGGRCRLCNRGARLEAHHRTYERRGNELPRDLIALCDTCHAKFHDKPVG